MQPAGSRVFLGRARGGCRARGVVVLGVLATAEPRRRRREAASPAAAARARPRLAHRSRGTRAPAGRAALQRQAGARKPAGDLRALPLARGAGRLGVRGLARRDRRARSRRSRPTHPRSSLVALHLGLAHLWTRHDAEAVTAWQRGEAAPARHVLRRARRTTSCTRSSRRACRASCPRSRRRSRSRCSRRRGSSPRSARGRGTAARTRRSSTAPRSSSSAVPSRPSGSSPRPRSLAPNDPEARVAAAVGLFDKADLSRAFSRLGPLVRVFPHAQTVRFHLGVMLVWAAQVEAARKQLRLAKAEAPRIAAWAGKPRAYLAALRGVGTR